MTLVVSSISALLDLKIIFNISVTIWGVNVILAGLLTMFDPINLDWITPFHVNKDSFYDYIRRNPMGIRSIGLTYFLVGIFIVYEFIFVPL